MDLDQKLAEIYGVTQPINGSWIQALAIEGFSVTEPFNGSWHLAVLNAIGVSFGRVDGELEIINGSVWQSIAKLFQGNRTSTYNGSWEWGVIVDLDVPPKDK